MSSYKDIFNCSSAISMLVFKIAVARFVMNVKINSYKLRIDYFKKKCFKFFIYLAFDLSNIRTFLIQMTVTRRNKLIGL